MLVALGSPASELQVLLVVRPLPEAEELRQEVLRELSRVQAWVLVDAAAAAFGAERALMTGPRP